MNRYLSGLDDKLFFEKSDLLENVRTVLPSISDSGFYRMMKKMLSNGEIMRVGRNAYCVPTRQMVVYSHQYLELSQDLADYIRGNYSDLDFRIFETVQLNEFLNHQIGRNVIFLSIEEDLGEFVFQDIRDRYNNNVLLYPSIELYHRYWKENMIVIDRLPTEAPKGSKEYCFRDLNLSKLNSLMLLKGHFPMLGKCPFSVVMGKYEV